MSDNYSYLVIPFGHFEGRIKDAVQAGDELRQVPSTQETLQEFRESTERWVVDTQDKLQSSFADHKNFFTQWFKETVMQRKKKYDIYWQEFNDCKEEIRMKCYILEQMLRTIQVCESIKDNSAEAKKGLTTNDKAWLLLSKLYELDNDSNHLARMLLVGNGVELKKPNEAIEIAKYLESKGLVDISHYAGQNDLYLTISTDGKVFYEEQTRSKKSAISSPNSIASMTSIFIVHGHNHGMKETVARAVQNMGFKPVILHEMPNQGRTVIEKFTEHSDEVQYAIVLLSADDFAYSKTETVKDGKLRPRQNVVFELGYFVGKLGRNRVFPLYETLDNFEIHSDFAGVVLVPFDNKGAWRMDLGKELEALGVNFDWKALMK
jgi:predicted nucleotide-binding protein